MAKIEVQEIGAASRGPAFGAGTLDVGVCLCCTAAGEYTRWCKHAKDQAALDVACGRLPTPPLRFPPRY